MKIAQKKIATVKKEAFKSLKNSETYFYKIFMK
jgi:hypothetical protein